MKKRLGALLLAVMMVMGIALLAGCSQKDAPPGVEKNTLVGTWKGVSVSYDGQEEVYDNELLFVSFSEDGELRNWMEDANNGKLLYDDGGTYTYTENTLTVFDADANKYEYTYKTSETTLTITATNDDGSTETTQLTRVQQKPSAPQDKSEVKKSEEPESSTLVGTWKLADAGDDEMNAELEGASAFLSFSEDGLWKFWYEVEIDGEIIEDGWGVYRISEDNLILLRPEEVDSYNDDEFENAAIYKISGTTLTITDTYDDGTTTMRLTRVQ